MIPTPPKYLKIRNIELIGKENPEFLIEVGSYAVTTKNITASSEVLCLLYLADGNRTLEEVFDQILSFNPLLTREEFNRLLEKLFDSNLLIEKPDKNVDERYNRHLSFYELNGCDAEKVQTKLGQSSVVILGVGGIGTWVSYLLSSSGVGHVHLVDGDVVEKNNLTRQVLFSESDIGQLKVDVAKKKLAENNPNVQYTVYPQSIRNGLHLEEMMDQIAIDIIILSADTPLSITEWVDIYATKRGVAWTRAGYANLVGVCGPLFVPGKTGCWYCNNIRTHNQNNFNNFPLVSEINKRYISPSFGALNGIVASMVSKEVVSWLGGLNDAINLLGNQIAIDFNSLQTTTTSWKRNPSCPKCSSLF
jgi:molybdopterin-synthase adenylyltransferase